MSTTQKKGQIPGYELLPSLDGTEELELAKGGKTYRGSVQGLIDMLPEGPEGPKGDPGADGAKGADGADGVNGKDAWVTWSELPENAGKGEADYYAAQKGEKGDVGPEGPKGDPGDDGQDGAKGDKGDDGQDGAPGLPVQIEGPYDKPEDLPPAASVGRNKLYVVGKNWYRAEGGNWVDLGEVQGPPGIGLIIMGSLPSIGDLPEQGAQTGETWIVEKQMMVWDSVQWSPVGVEGPQGIRGEKGDKGDKGDPGNEGPKGDPGNDGENASYVGEYDTVAERPETGNPGDLIWVKDGGDGFGHTFAWDKVGNAWLDLGAGRIGPKGDKGDKGDEGAPSRLRGKVADNAALPATGEPGESWFVEDFNGTGVGHTVSWGVDDQQWIDLGPGQAGPKGDKGDPGNDGNDGAKGDKGDKGDTGADGKDAFEVWKTIPGNEDKTIEEWETFIEGKEGPKGDPGADGAKGDTGDRGLKGDPGDALQSGGKLDSVDDLPDPVGYPVNVFFNINSRMWMIVEGQWADVGPVGAKGDKGDPGNDGAKGADGADGAKGDKGDKGDTGANGVGITPKGTVADKASLPTEGVVANDTYVTDDDGQGWSWSDQINDWVSVGIWRGPEGPKGDKGDPGNNGADGAEGPKGDKGDPGDEGGQGPQGDKGDPASIFVYKGSKETAAELDSVVGASGDAWVVNSENRVYLYNPETSAFEQGPEIGGIVGPEGPRGPQGTKGERGPQGSEILIGEDNPTALTGKVTDLFLNSVSKELFRKQTDLLWVSLGFLSGSDVNEVAVEGIHARKTGGWVKLPDLPITENMLPGDMFGLTVDSQGELVYGKVGSPITEITPLVGTTLDRANGSYFTVTPATDLALTVAPFRDNTFAMMVLRVNGSAGAVSFTGVEWGDDGAPMQGSDFTTYVFYWDGVAKLWTGNRGSTGALS